MKHAGGRAALALAALVLTALVLAGCAGFPGSGKPADDVPQAMTAAEIRTTLAGRSWRFQGPNNTGTTLYAEDGSSLVEVDSKGKTKGKWMTKDGQLCESFDPSPPWLPGGVPMSCYPFARGATPNTYQAGKAVFSPAS
ncbi:hypothetical protein [Aestuariivirga sp.]|uniref:hypothetical protein n=1 Tax=Aestuariivirga sp. TaxID=2650926 RepID=UPI0025B7E027|nr:hypothetical protein [Aestuariivirga sp.]MCA3556221.1 hypothetical protein [Aestuariivirga sp.]